MPVPKENVEKNRYKKQRRWSLIGMLSKRKKFKKSQDSVDFCPYDGKINNKVAQNRYLELSEDCPIEQYTCSPRQIRRCNSLQYTGQVSGHSNVTGQPKPDEWKSSLQSVNSSSASSYSDDVGAYKSRENSGQSLSCFDDEINQPMSRSVSKKVPFRCSSEIGRYQIDHKRHFKPCSAVGSKPLVGKKIPPPPPPRDPNVKATYYYRNNRLVSRESDSTYFSQGSDDDDNVAADACGFYENQTDDGGHLAVANEPPRSRRPIQIRDVETLSSESDGSAPRTQSAEEALRELEDIYNSLGLSDEDLLDRAERRDLPTLHQNMRYQSSDELLRDCSITLNRRILPKTRRSGVPDIVSDDMAYRRLNKKEPKRPNVVPAGSFLLVLPTVYNVDYVDYEKKPSGEPDVTLDDVVFRNRRRHLNFFRVPDPQPPFGIPLGPVVGAAPSDYLHAVPECRYRPSFRPRRSPDTVEDDLAFRALRKENKCETRVVRRGPRFDGLSEETLLLDNGGRVTKNDARWITPVKNAKTVRFAVLGGATTDCRPADDGPSLAEINPIVLSAAAFALNGESLFFRCEPAGPRLLTDTATSLCTPDCAQLTTITIAKDRSLKGCAPPAPLLLPRGRCDGKKPPSSPPRVRFAAVKLKGPPNFRDLIRREYVLHGCRRHGPPESRLNAAAVQHRSDAVTATTAVNRTDRDSGSGAPAAGSDCETTARSAKVPESAAPAAVSTGPNRMPNRLEACLYVTVCVYQLFSVNAYSAFLSLIFLVAILHVCR